MRGAGLAVLAAGGAAHGQIDALPGRPGGAAELVGVRLLADAAAIGPGQTVHLAVIFSLEPAWHIYWKNPGEGAMAPEITVEAPSGFAVGEPLWPRPIAVATAMGPEYCYRDETVLFVPVTAPDPLADGGVTFHARISWAVCKDVCKLGSASRSLDLATRGSPVSPGDLVDPVIRKHRNRLPRPLAEAAGAAVDFDGTTLRLGGPAHGHSMAAFYPAESPGVTYGSAETSVADDRFQVAVEVDLDPRNALDEPMVIGGLVVVGEEVDDPCYDFQLPLPSR